MTDTTSLISDLVGILQGIGVDPQGLSVEDRVADDPTVVITFHTVADLRAFAAAEKAKVDHTNRGYRGYHEFSALYDRPGRRMLLRAFVFAHSPEWDEIAR